MTKDNAEFNPEEYRNRTVKSKWFPKFFEKIPDQSGKVVVITGTSAGLGTVAAKTSLKKGAVVVMLNRNSEKAENGLKDLYEQNPELKEKSVFITCDLQSFESVKKAAEEIINKFEDSGIDVLCHNAGVMMLPNTKTVDGYDIQMQTNHLSAFLLTKLLYPLLAKRAEVTGEARVVNHSSIARLMPGWLRSKYFQKGAGKLGKDHSYPPFGSFQRYHQTKLANSVFTIEMQKRLHKAKSKVSVYCAHPGTADSELVAKVYENGADSKMMKNAVKSLQSCEDGTMGILTCMYLPKLKKGGMYGPKMTKGPAVHLWHGIQSTSYAGKLLWRESEKAVGEFKI